jgi:hypothetical protein
MALYSPSRFSRPRSGPLLPDDRRWPSVHSVPPPVGSFAPATLPVRGIHFPTRSVPPGLPCGSHRWRAPVVSSRLTSWRFTLPRRGLPHPLRSAYAVSHDLDGLPLLGPCEVFRSLTSMGFGPGSLLHSPGRSARRPAFPVRVRPNFTEVRSGRTQGASCRAGGSRSTPRRTAAEASIRAAWPPLRPFQKCHRSDAAFPNGPVPAPSQSSVPSPCPDHRSGHSSGLRSLPASIRR